MTGRPLVVYAPSMMRRQRRRHGRRTHSLAWKMTIPGTYEALTSHGRYVTILLNGGVELTYAWGSSWHWERLGMFDTAADARTFAARHSAGWRPW